MPLWFAGLLGLVQGLTEFLPVSSTAHLRLAPVLFGQPDPGAPFTAVIQLGTLAAVVAYFARDLLIDLPRAALRGPRDPAGRLPWLLVLGTVPIVILGVALKPLIVGDARSLWVVGTALAGVGALLILVDRRAPLAGGRAVVDVGVRDALLIGLAQAAALVPGVSRSGATLCMALVLGLGRRDAARFSFLLSVPAITGAAVLEFGDALDHLGADAALPLAVATLAAAVSGYLSIGWLMRWLGSHRLTGFGVYRIAIGGAILVLCAVGTITPR